MNKFKVTKFQTFMEMAARVFLFPLFILGIILKFYDKITSFKNKKNKKTHHFFDDEL